LLAALATALPEALPVKWGDIEPYRIRVTPSDFQQAIDFWVESSRDYNTIQGRTDTRKGCKSCVLVSFACGPRSGQTHDISIFLQKTLAGNAENSAQLLAQIARQWLALLDADYARVCLEDEWYTKNVVEQFIDPDGSINPWMVFNQNITKGMPGVYWMTYFGNIFVDWIGERRVHTSPWPTIEKLGDGYLLQRSSSAGNWENENTLDDALVEHLGRERFFEMNQYERLVQAPHFEMPDPYTQLNIVQKTGEVTPVQVPKQLKRKSKTSLARSTTPKEETEELLNAGMPLIEQTLAKYGEFFPIAVIKTTAGKIEHVAVGEDGEAAAVYGQLEAVLRSGASAKQYRAVAIYCDRHVQRPEDSKSIEAVHVGLEHAAGYTVDVYFPYIRTNEGGLSIGEPFASARQSIFFAQGDNSREG
jgi:hypothetical protein